MDYPCLWKTYHWFFGTIIVVIFSLLSLFKLFIEGNKIEASGISRKNRPTGSYAVVRRPLLKI